MQVPAVGSHEFFGGHLRRQNLFCSREHDSQDVVVCNCETPSADAHVVRSLALSIAHLASLLLGCNYLCALLGRNPTRRMTCQTWWASPIVIVMTWTVQTGHTTVSVGMQWVRCCVSFSCVPCHCVAMCESVGHGNIGCHSGGGTQTAGQAKLPKRGVAELKAMLAQMGAIHIADLQDVRSEVFAGVSGGFPDSGHYFVSISERSPTAGLKHWHALVPNMCMVYMLKYACKP